MSAAPPTPDDLAFWERVAAHGYAPPDGYAVSTLTPFLLEKLRDDDPQWRDDVAYSTLAAWVAAGLYDADDLRLLVARWTDDLHYGLGEQGTSTVAVRAFAALLLSVVTYHDGRAGHFAPEEVAALQDTALAYLRAERDLRGYDDDLGWLHAVAHSADWLKFLARHPHTGAAGLALILDAVAALVTALRDDVFTHSEDERLAWVVVEVLRRGLLREADLLVWAERLGAVAREDDAPDTGLKTTRGQHGAYQNTKHLLRAVQARLAYSEHDDPGALPGGALLHAKLFALGRLFLK